MVARLAFTISNLSLSLILAFNSSNYICLDLLGLLAGLSFCVGY